MNKAPLLLKNKAALRKFIKSAKKDGKTIALVPTMGALHAGHASLIKKARQLADAVVVSVFVNPTQFGPNEDFAKYPRTLKEDLLVCQEMGADAVFAPQPKEMYFDDRSAWVNEEALSRFLCGARRIGHFKGVCTVVSKLFNLVQPDFACFGKKDAQQLLILERMVRDLDFPIKIVECPLIREKSGLALSSRNKYLSPEEKKEALVLSRSLKAAKDAVAKGKSAAETKKLIAKIIATSPLAKIDYISVCDRETLEEVKTFKKGQKILVALAVYFGTTRLIDNVWLTTPKK
ncbi:pantoate--beta-alanine ligase [bacterium]|nr:pantoate--beta-alanine ligase [bacterium]MBR5625150.1 pantoate--beta-alanine ligase [bacterium]